MLTREGAGRKPWHIFGENGWRILTENLHDRRAGLIADLGGDPTVAQTALVDLAIRQWALLDSVDAFLLQLPSPVDKRHRRVWPVVLDRSRLAAQLEGTLARLGLQRREKDVPSFDKYLAEKEWERRASDGEAADPELAKYLRKRDRP